MPRLGDEGKSNFWCNRCYEDYFDLRARCIQKGSEKMWQADCPKCRDRLSRFIDHPINDPYFRDSKFCEEERRKYWKDFIPRGHPEFKKYWGKDEDRKQIAEMEEKERREFERKRQLNPSKNLQGF